MYTNLEYVCDMMLRDNRLKHHFGESMTFDKLVKLQKDFIIAEDWISAAVCCGLMRIDPKMVEDIFVNGEEFVKNLKKNIDKHI